MNNAIYTVTVGSLQELQSKISADQKKGKFNYEFIAISSTDPNISVCPFHLPNAPYPKLAALLKEEANQLLSIKDVDIELDFQVFNRRNGMVDGLFVCMPRKILEEYIRICDRAKLIPIHFTAGILTAIGASFEKHKEETDNFCILEFTKDMYVNLAVFCNKKCEFIRRMKNDNPDEVRRDVLQSIRSASAKSELKGIPKIFIGGETKNQKALVSAIVNDTNAQLKEAGDNDQAPGAIDFRQNYFLVNLARNYSFSLPRRKQFMLASHIILGVLGLFLLIGLGRLLWIQVNIAKLKSSFSAADLNHARELKAQLESMPDAE
jgi:hypothetical protein